MWGQNSNAYDLYIVGQKILSGLILSEELLSKNRHTDRKPKDIFLNVGFSRYEENDLSKSQQLFN